MPKLDHPIPRAMSFHGGGPFEVVPRIGESVSIPGSGDPKVFRVTRVQHTIGEPIAPDRASILIEVTSNIL